ncbi:hypothetical protein HaLaN_00024 [Haematococcus lacustris]|uniref:Uncharacterized protein n=1 Tax=Haematococcus lacustris TaxID=44745 RepID=A0A699YEY7_HAELA|nr:hypothetical protein HaLaN_00024 [Haematococcus lacustris]
MSDAGMLGVLTEEGLTSLDKFRNGAPPDPAEPGKFIEGPKDSQVTCRSTRRAAADGQGHGPSQPVGTSSRGVAGRGPGQNQYGHCGARGAQRCRHSGVNTTAGQYYRDSGMTRQAQATKTWLAEVKPQLTALSQVSSKPSSLASYRRFTDTVLATYDAHVGRGLEAALGQRQVQTVLWQEARGGFVLGQGQQAGKEGRNISNMT